MAKYDLNQRLYYRVVGNLGLEPKTQRYTLNLFDRQPVEKVCPSTKPKPKPATKKKNKKPKMVKCDLCHVNVQSMWSHKKSKKHQKMVLFNKAAEEASEDENEDVNRSENEVDVQEIIDEAKKVLGV
jgi:E3 ubiquitin-protein ligase DOA10